MALYIVGSNKEEIKKLNTEHPDSYQMTDLQLKMFYTTEIPPTHLSVQEQYSAL